MDLKAEAEKFADWIDNKRDCGDCPCPIEFGGTGKCDDLVLFLESLLCKAYNAGLLKGTEHNK